MWLGGILPAGKAPAESSKSLAPFRAGSFGLAELCVPSELHRSRGSRLILEIITLQKCFLHLGSGVCDAQSIPRGAQKDKKAAEAPKHQLQGHWQNTFV